MEKTKEEIIKLRKELRNQYAEVGLKLYLIVKETDEFLKRIGEEIDIQNDD